MTCLHGTQELRDAALTCFLPACLPPRSFVMLTCHRSLLARLPPRISDCVPEYLSVFNTSTPLSLNGEESAFPAMQKEQNQTDKSQIPTARINCGRGNLGKKSPCFQIQMYHMSTGKERMLPHTTLDGHHQKTYKQQILEKLWRKGNPLTLLVGM